MVKLKIVDAIFVSIIFAVSTPAFPQDANQADREAMFLKYLDFSSYVKGGRVEPHWMADGNSFWYAEHQSNNTIIWKVDPTKENAKEPFFDVRRLRRVLADTLGHKPAAVGLPFDTFDFEDGRNDLVRFRAEGHEFILDLNNYTIRSSLPAFDREDVNYGYDDGQLSPDGNWFVGRRDNTVWLQSTSTSEGEEHAVTDKGSEDLVWGSRWMFDVEWSPDSKTFALYRTDYTKVFKTPIVDYLTSPESIQWLPNPYQARSPIERQELFVVDRHSNRRVEVRIGQSPYEGMWFMGWLPDSSALLYVEMDRYLRKFRLMAASRSTGEAREIIAESHQNAYGDMYARAALTLLDNGKRFVWISQRDGWRRLYLYDIDGTLIRTLTNGDYRVDDVVAVDEKEGWIYFIAFVDKDRPYDTHLCRISFEGREFKQLTKVEDQHRVEVSPSKQFFLDSHSSPSRPPKVELRRADGTLVESISESNVDALAGLKWRPPEEFVVKAADGKDLHGILYKPYDFDPNKKYPVIDSMYGVPRAFLEDPIPHALAQLGFVVTMVDARRPWIGGVRGREFEEVTYGSFGRYEIPERVHVLNELAKTRPYLDLGRVGIFGGSFPGYFAVRGMLQAPDTYHVGVAVAPVIDLYTHANYLWLGPPDSNDEEYRFSSNVRLANELKGKLLLIHGTADYAVPIAHTMKMADALIRADKPFDQMIIPGCEHWTGNDHEMFERYWMKAAGRYFVEHLRP